MTSSQNRNELVRALVSTGMQSIGLGAVDPLVQLLVKPLSEEIQRRRSIALRAAEDLSGLSREELADRIEAVPEGVDRLVRVLYAAGMTGYDDALKMMGQSLSRRLAATDARQQAKEDAMLSVLDGIEPRHVQMLTAIHSYNQRAGVMGNVKVAQAVAGSDQFPDRTAFELLARALVDDPYGRVGGDDGEERFYQVSDLGRLLLEAAAEVDARGPAASA